MTHLTERAPEKGHYTVTASSTEAATALKWSLVDEDGTVINSRSSVAIATPTTANSIELDGDDLAIANSRKLRRWLTVYGTYSGGTKTIAGECSFDIDPLKGRS